MPPPQPRPLLPPSMESNNCIAFLEQLPGIGGRRALLLDKNRDSEDPPKTPRIKMWSLDRISQAQLSRAHLDEMAFQETRYETVAQFVEWAYRSDYTEVVPMPVGLPQGEQPSPPSKSASLESVDKKTLNVPTETAASMNSDSLSQTHTLQSHPRVYIFSNIYIVPRLKDLEFKKFTAVLKWIEKPEIIGEQLAVIDCLELGFSKIPHHDNLLTWMVCYAAWCVDKLRLQSKFHDVLQTLPMIGCRMMNELRSAERTPWDVDRPEHKFPPYDVRGPLENLDYY